MYNIPLHFFTELQNEFIINDRQKTTNPEKNNANFHSEVGYIRMPGMQDRVELILAQPTGKFTFQPINA